MGLLPHDMPKLAWNMAGTQSAHQRRAAALSSAVGFVVGFVPWIVYWILVGNAPFIVAVLAGLGLAVAINAITRARRQPLMVLEAGTAVVFAVFVLMALILSDDFLERWLQPLGNAWRRRCRVALRRDGPAPARSASPGRGGPGSAGPTADVSRRRPPHPARLLADDRGSRRIDQARRHTCWPRRRPGRHDTTGHRPLRLLTAQVAGSPILSAFSAPASSWLPAGSSWWPPNCCRMAEST